MRTFNYKSIKKSIIPSLSGLIIWIIIGLFPIEVFSQFDDIYCATLDKSFYGNLENSSSSLLLNCHDDETTKIVSINIHFLLDGTGGGNYTETQGLNGGSYNGIDIANDIVETANWLFAHNNQLFQPIGNNTPIEPVNIQWELRGVYFDDNSTAFNSNIFNFESRLSSLNENPGSEINVYFTTVDIGASGVASSIGLVSNYNIALLGNFNYFEDNVVHPVLPFRFKLFWFADLMNHELGHLLDLQHPFSRTSGSDCSSLERDNCEDTYTFCNPRNGNGNACFYPLSPIVNPYDGRTCTANEYSNTFMDYNINHKGISPCQIERMHNDLCNNGQNYYTECDGNSLLVYEQGSSIPSGTNYSSGAILASGNANNSGTTNLHAGVSIELEPGFQTFIGSGDIFNAGIRECEEVNLRISRIPPFANSITTTAPQVGIDIYPNPADGFINIDMTNLKSDIGFLIELFDSYGKLVHNAKSGNQLSSIDFRNKGLYLIKITNLSTSEVIHSQKVVNN